MTLDRFSAWFAAAGILLVLAHALAGDSLFPYSDWLSATCILVALALGLALPFALADQAAVWLVKGWQARSAPLLFGAPLALSIASGAVFALEAVFGAMQGGVLRTGLFACAIVIATVVVLVLPDRAGLLNRTRLLARAATIIGLVALAGVALHARLPVLSASASHADAVRHAILIVIDGQPAQYLKAFNPAGRPTAFDPVAARGRVFTAARTNRVYTSGYFDALWKGRLDRYTADVGAETLMARLERAGGAFRWIAYHSNGIPEAVNISRYGGLRSAFLTETYAWIPRLLGLNHHVFLNWPKTRDYMRGPASRVLQAINPPFVEDDVWTRLLPAEILDVRSRADASLLVFHVSATANPVQAMPDMEAHLAGAQDFYQRAIAQEYSYGPADMSFAAYMRQKYAERTELYGRRVWTLVNWLQAEGLLDRTLLVVTADHGSIAERGRVWYGYHSDEEVTRVPLILLGAVPAGEVHTIVDTMDLSKTLSAYLRLTGEWTPEGRSLLSEEFGERPVAVASLPADGRQEWFLTIYAEGKKYRFNLHRAGGGEAVAAALSGFDWASEPLAVAPDDPIWRVLVATMRDHAIAAEQVHHRYKALLTIFG